MADEIYIAKEQTSQEIKTILGKPNDTGGGATAGSVMAKTNLILDRVGINHSIKDIFGRVYVPAVGVESISIIPNPAFSGKVATESFVFASDATHLYVVFSTTPKMIQKYSLINGTLVEEKQIVGEVTFVSIQYASMCINDDYIFILSLQSVARINKSTYVVEQVVTGDGNYRRSKCDEKYLYGTYGSGLFRRYLISNLNSYVEISGVSLHNFCVKDGFIYCISSASPYVLQKIARESLSSVLITRPSYPNAVMEFNENNNLLMSGLGITTVEISPDTFENVRTFPIVIPNVAGSSEYSSFYMDKAFVFRCVRMVSSVAYAFIYIMDMRFEKYYSSSELTRASYPAVVINGLVCGFSSVDKTTFMAVGQIEGYVRKDGV